VSIASVIQHVMYKHHITLSSVACLLLTYFSQYVINSKTFRIKLVKIKCVF